MTNGKFREMLKFNRWYEWVKTKVFAVINIILHQHIKSSICISPFVKIQILKNYFSPKFSDLDKLDEIVDTALGISQLSLLHPRACPISKFCPSAFKCCSSTGCIGYIRLLSAADTTLLLYTLLCLCRSHSILLLYMTDQWAIYLYR